ATDINSLLKMLGVSSGVSCLYKVSRAHKRFDCGQRVGGSKMGIPHSHLDRFMAHEFRDGTKINSGHHQTAGKTMSQAVPRKVLYPGLANCRIKPVLVACERFPMNTNKNSSRTSGK